MLINLRNALMTGKRLPYDAEVDYLMTNEDAYINTGITPQNDIGFIVDFMCTKLNRANHIIGASDGVARMELFVRTTNADTANVTVYFGGAPDNTNDGTAWYMRRATIAVNYLNSRVTEIDNNYLSSLGSFSTTIDRPIYLLGYNSNGTATVSRDLRVYRAQISSGASLVRDYIPVRVGAVGYMYDRVSSALFGNAGTGAFIIGPDKVSSVRGGYKRKCVRRSYRRSSRPSVRFWQPRLWKEVA